MAEEFEESEVIFSEELSFRRGDEENLAIGRREISDVGEKSRNETRNNKTAAFSNSLPVNIPENVFRKHRVAEDAEEEYSGRGSEIVPPHVIVGRRIARQMAFSVCTGNGRTLKGRDLSRVRNSVLRLTGFLEA